MTMYVRWQWQRFEDLSGQEMHEILAVRQEVFVVEQSCIYRDADQFDSVSLHLTGRADGGPILVYARLLAPDTRFPEPSFGRVLTVASVRNKGLARRVVSLVIDRCRQDYPGQMIRISAQVYLQKLYAEFGFLVVGESYNEDGIAHVEMILKAQQ